MKKLHAAEQELFAAFTEELTRFETANIDLSTAETAIGVCRMYLSQLKTLVQEHGFADKDEEIVFFKHSKPRYLVPLISIETSIRFIHNGQKEVK